VGCVLTLPLNNISTEVGSFRTFSTFTFNFHVSPAVMAVGVTFAILIGAAGGLLPARTASNREIIAVLRAR
jgi:ABC-type antimicrobial peptide transport system permease subunit